MSRSRSSSGLSETFIRADRKGARRACRRFDKLLRASHATGVSRGADFRITVTFDQDVSKCAYLSTPLGIGSSDSLSPTTEPHPSDSHKVIVATQFPDSTIVNSGFSLVVFC